jgi:hypothetical protein
MAARALDAEIPLVKTDVEVSNRNLLRFIITISCLVAYRNGWQCQFLEADLKTSLPRRLHFATSDIRCDILSL